MRWPSVPRTALGASRAAQTREDRRPLALLRRGGSRGRAWVQQALPVGLSAAHVQGHGQLRHVRGAPPTAGRWPLSKEGLGERSSPPPPRGPPTAQGEGCHTDSGTGDVPDVIRSPV